MRKHGTFRVPFKVVTDGHDLLRFGTLRPWDVMS